MNLQIIIKCIISYFVVFFLLKFMGKREVGQLSLFDLVVLLIIADIAVTAVEVPDKDFYSFMISLLILGGIQKIIAIILLKFPKLRNFFDGKESLIICNGKLDKNEMRRLGYNMDDLLTQLRLKNIRSIQEVRFAILETNGEISIFKYHCDDSETNVQKGSTSLAVKTSKETLSLTPFPLIVSGVIRKDNLKILHLSRKWLIEELKKEGYDDYDKILYCSYDNGKLFIIDD